MKTTLNIHADTLKNITRAARLKGISRQDLIVMLLKKTMDDPSKAVRLGRLVRYQKRAAQEDWRAFHVQLREDDYEYFLDLRKLLKMSVSLILAIAVKRYLKNPADRASLIKALKHGDNYLYKDYVILSEKIQGIVSWRFFWGFPPDIGPLIQ
jgi:hypothetical protein